MSLKYFVLNTLLCFVILLIAIRSYETWNHSFELIPDTMIVPKKSEAINENPPMMASTEEPMSLQSYILISEKNIFSPERKDFPITPLEKAAKPILRPQVILYGVAIAKDYQSATVVNPGRPLRKEERETLTIKIGEEIGEYKLVKILPDRIAMESNGDTFEVLLYDSKNSKRRMEGRTETKPAMVASPQPAPISPLAEAPKPTPSQVSVQKPKVEFQAQGPPSLPFNKYTYQLLGPSAEIRRGRIFYPAPELSAQESVGK